MDGPENGNFPLLDAMKMSFCREWVVLKILKTPLRNIKMSPNLFHIYLLWLATSLVGILEMRRIPRNLNSTIVYVL